MPLDLAFDDILADFGDKNGVEYAKFCWVLKMDEDFLHSESNLEIHGVCENPALSQSAGHKFLGHMI